LIGSHGERLDGEPLARAEDGRVHDQPVLVDPGANTAHL
jgi:hypothetical protein